MADVEAAPGSGWTGGTPPVAEDAGGRQPGAAFDPLRYCIFTTIAVIAWLAGPPLAVALMSGLGLFAYQRAWRAGLRRSRCLLGDVRLVVAYLAIAFVAGTAVAVERMASWLI